MAANPDVTRWASYFRLAVATYPTNTVPDLMAQCGQESGGNPDARSPAGALGLMQIMPGTGAGLGLTTDAEFLNPKLSILAGAHLMQQLREQFASYPDCLSLALAGYNAGPGAVVAAGYRVPDIPQTEAYVAAITAAVPDYGAYGLWMPAQALPEVREWEDGPAVALLQHLLGVTVDGQYGPATLAAVVAAKHRYGLPPNGTVGAGLWQALVGQK